MKYYTIYCVVDGSEYYDPMDATTRAEALEELRAMWHDLGPAARDRREAFLAFEMDTNTDLEEITWSSVDMCSDRWLIEYPDDGHGGVGGTGCYPNYEMAMNEAECWLQTRPYVKVKAWHDTCYDTLVTLHSWLLAPEDN